MSHAKPGERSAGWRAAALLLACSLYALLVLWTGSYPGTPFVWLIASAIGGVVLIVIWAVLLYPGPLKLWAEIVGVSVAAAAIVGSIAGLSLLARFAASAADFNAVAQTLPAPAGVRAAA